MWVEARILELGNIFACGVHAWAVMSNHLHIVVHMSPSTANAWSRKKLPHAGLSFIRPALPRFARNFIDQIFWLYDDLIRLRSPAG